ncbi:CLP1-like mRNA cleavage and polyadenylation factor [Hamiltosporidium magnivora]|uniref:Polynucleotide 5'-hydroxyl-kinase GRC3 n=1 Tax=Hamiltosporidium magnivora TaxID=148818 RepID=A0A4Q9L7Z0_9MICR|nr:CLP1-like mRNA cleavage and polyadenylation factor [Hamiltosporidium magnivora]
MYFTKKLRNLNRFGCNNVHPFKMQRNHSISTEKEMPPNYELRLEISEEKQLKITVLQGNCEVKGQELLLEKTYLFSSIKTFLYTFTGCKIKLEGSYDVMYMSAQTNVPNIFKFFMSQLSEPTFEKILVIGKGRSTFSTILTNFFIRLHRKVLFTDLDPQCSNIIFPGTISSTIVDKLIDYKDGISVYQPLVYFYGNTVLNNLEYYFLLLQELQNAIIKKSHKDIHIFICPNNISDEHFKKICNIFEINKVIVIGDERLFSFLEFEPKINICQSNGYIDALNDLNYNFENEKISKYFYGSDNEYTPYSINLKIGTNLSVVSICEENILPATALPLGTVRKAGFGEIKDVRPSIGSVLAISDSDRRDNVHISPVIGFFVVNSTDTITKVLAPQSKPPKASFLIQGDIKYTGDLR